MATAGGITVPVHSDTQAQQQQEPLSLTIRGPRPVPNWRTGSAGRSAGQRTSGTRPAIPDFNPDAPTAAAASDSEPAAKTASYASYKDSITPTGTLTRYLVSNGFIPAQLDAFTSATVQSTGRAFGPRPAPFPPKPVQSASEHEAGSSQVGVFSSSYGGIDGGDDDDDEDGGHGEDEEELLEEAMKAAHAQLAQQRQMDNASDVDDSDGEDDILSVLMAMSTLNSKEAPAAPSTAPTEPEQPSMTEQPSPPVIEMQSIPVAATTALFTASAKEEAAMEAATPPATSDRPIECASSVASHDVPAPHSTAHSPAMQAVNPLPSPPSPRIDEMARPSSTGTSASVPADYANHPLPPIPPSPSAQQLHVQPPRVDPEPYQRPPSHPSSPSPATSIARPASVHSQSSFLMSSSNNNNNQRPMYSGSRPPSNASSAHPSPHLGPGHPPTKAALTGPPLPPSANMQATPPKRANHSTVNGEALRANLIRPLSLEALERMRAELVGSQDPAQQLRFARFAQCTAESMPMSGTPVNDPRKRLLDDAFAIIDRLAKANNGEAVYIKGTWYAAGKMGNTRDADKALKYYQRAAKLGYPKASFQIGRHYENDPNRAMQFYQRASALGDADANYRMGTIYLHGDLKQRPNPSQALKYLKRAATAPEPSVKAALLLAELLADRNAELRIDPLDRDANEAVHMYHIAAELEMPVAQRELGRIYEDGLMGCARDPALSASWFQRAADSNDAVAALAMSAWCIKGVPGRFDRDDRAAFEWCRKAVEQGLPDAEYTFGYYHEAGIGVQMDRDVAIAWYRKAAGGGSALARERLHQLENGAMPAQAAPSVVPGYGHLPSPHQAPPPHSGHPYHQMAGPPHSQGYPTTMMSPTSPSGQSFHSPHHGPATAATATPNYMPISGYGGAPPPQQQQQPPPMSYGHQGQMYQQPPYQPQPSPYRR